MTSPAVLTVGGVAPAVSVDVDIVIPVHNEAAGLELSVRRLHRYLTDRFPLSWTITIADNASQDQTWGIACRLANDLAGVRAVHLREKGRGRALRAAWSASTARIVAYTDVDLSTDLDALLPLVAPLLSGHSDVAIGSRLAAGARVVRGPRREVISRTYNLLLRATLHNGFSDAQCGFKAVRGDVVHALLPLIEDDGWFFAPELLGLAEHNGLRIHEVPVDWVDDPDSRVDVVRTALGDLRGLWRVWRRLAAGKGRLAPSSPDRRGPGGRSGTLTTRFAGIGGVSTVAYLAVFCLLQLALGRVSAAAVALTVTAVANAAAHWRYTLAAHRPSGRRFLEASALAWAAGV